jgi:predicted metal-dependent HD superfamily phosphohydrolase
MSTFEQYAACFNNNENTELKTSFFENLTKDYNGEGRYYHTMRHVEALLKWSNQHAAQLQQKDVVDLAIIYHDVIYDPTRRDNEEKSAERAVQELTQLNFPKEKIELVQKYILATKGHNVPKGQENSDMAYMLDFDLSILGTNWEDYLTYAQNIRREYQVIPDSMFFPGRIRVLESFLQKPKIYYTSSFQQAIEAAARKNIEAEIKWLKK